MKKYSEIITEMIEANDKKDLPKKHNWVGIIIHHTSIGDIPTSETKWRSLNKNVANWLAKKDENYVSAHFQIGYYGEIIQLVDPREHIAFHAGKSELFHPIERKLMSGCNEFTIGIELLGDGNHLPYSEECYGSLIALTRELLAEFPTIDPRCITGHENVSPGRKVDPGFYFNWARYFRGIFSLQSL